MKILQNKITGTHTSFSTNNGGTKVKLWQWWHEREGGDRRQETQRVSEKQNVNGSHSASEHVC
jgi:hypothetical protein